MEVGFKKNLPKLSLWEVNVVKAEAEGTIPSPSHISQILEQGTALAVPSWLIPPLGWRQEFPNSCLPPLLGVTLG